MPKRLTLKQKKFADEYLKTGNAKKSAKKAYDIKENTKNPEHTAESIGSENLSKPDIIQYFKDISEGASNRIEVLSKTAKNENVKYTANKDILDRAGYKATDRVEMNIQTPKPLLDSILDDDGNLKPTQAAVSKENIKVDVNTIQRG